jgi:hypothetical protein
MFFGRVEEGAAFPLFEPPLELERQCLDPGCSTAVGFYLPSLPGSLRIINSRAGK